MLPRLPDSSRSVRSATQEAAVGMSDTLAMPRITGQRLPPPHALGASVLGETSTSPPAAQIPSLGRLPPPGLLCMQLSSGRREEAFSPLLSQGGVARSAGVVTLVINRQALQATHVKLNNNPTLKSRRRQLRTTLTPAEARLWKQLQNRKLAGRKFRRQHSVGRYFLDFYCPQEPRGGARRCGARS